MGPALPALLDDTGNPLSPHVQRVLHDLRPRLRRTFPGLQDEAVVANMLEEAGRRIAEAERRLGPLEELHGYAWVTLRSVVTSRLRRSAARVEQATLGSSESAEILARSAAAAGTPERIEREILLQEVLARLAPEEQRILLWKKMGFSSQEIGQRRSMSTAAVDMAWSRLCAKIRLALNENGAAPPLDAGVPSSRERETE